MAANVAANVNTRGELLALGLAPRTATTYVRVIRRAEEWCEGRGFALATVPAPTIMEWVQEQRRGFASRKLVRSALNYYWDIVGRVEKRPTIKVPPKPRMECKALEEDEAALLARAAARRGDEPGLAVLVGLYTALRREEIARLRWDDFRQDWSVVHVIGKAQVSATVPVHPFLAARLRTWPKWSPWAFPSVKPGRSHVGPSTVWAWTRLVAEEAGLPPVPPHVLRHTALAQALDRTKDLRAVQRFGRHADPAVTAGYTRVTGARLHAVVMSLDFATSGSPPPAEEDGGLRLAA